MTREALTTETAPPVTRALCCHCKRWTYAAVEVGYIERASGPGVVLWGCPSHAMAMIPRPMPGELERGA
ncbi:hypothetical protein ACFW2Y_12905 [Streptomyces sp. NPDC058877]|uniref:hypothetical protein n=1 Tax=Streptomyces sp. NPDC058877 TaxID=3346665 RepID=UPI0036CADA33